ncbi:hypothetical protein [Homoserinibacter sp. GY 40078]|uniref:hypothetical protein n=1 Tax=Homoserinibacter sp. GY 40078 TaxID=2603275 RepID=UPI0011CB3AE5|nr:hypothetical protein [Homoserinibacter sp. GY 40078]TXK17710.1 hypothetical protein FVQ89_12985 [Homoserinibacter sp. GY 40078]
MTNSDGEPAVLSVGFILGDSDAENNAWGLAIRSVMKQVIKASEGVVSPLRVNVVYHVDGKLAPNEFEGVRTGRFSRRDSHLMVQAAVPPGEVSDRYEVLLNLLGEAIDEAESFARRKGIAENLDSIRALVESLTPN